MKSDANFDAASQAMGATGLVKVIPNFGGKKIPNTNKQQAHTVCGSTNAPIQNATITPEDLVHLDIDFGISCKLLADITAVDDSYADIGCGKFGLVGNVLRNDVLNEGSPATIELVNLTLPENNTAGNANITIDPSGNVNVSSLTPAGTYTYTYQICEKQNPDNCDTATVTITVVPNAVTMITSQACNDDSTILNLSNLLPTNTSTTGTWVDISKSNGLQGNNLNPVGLALGTYIFDYVITDESCPRSIRLNMEVNDDCIVLACENVVVHNAFTPNGDGINDFFKIDNIDSTTCYPENTVEIYNRWGILVFETSNYNNTNNAFDGNSRGRTSLKQSEGLPTGTYFYIINYKSLDGNNVLQSNKKDGYLYLSR